MISRHLAFAALPIIALSATRSTAQSGGGVLRVGGFYTAYGMNADGSKYQGEVQVSQVGSTVELFWAVGGQQ
ncbi:MAG: hypothetical protein AAF231_15770, partial [Pseudomonadota bacterium]